VCERKRKKQKERERERERGGVMYKLFLCDEGGVNGVDGDYGYTVTMKIYDENGISVYASIFIYIYIYDRIHT